VPGVAAGDPAPSCARALAGAAGHRRTSRHGNRSLPRTRPVGRNVQVFPFIVIVWGGGLSVGRGHFEGSTVQHVTEETGVILAGGFPRRGDSGTHPLPTPGASGGRRGLGGCWSPGEARPVYLVKRGDAGRSRGCCARTGCGIRGWSPSFSLPLRAALLPGQSRTVCTCLWGLMMLGRG